MFDLSGKTALITGAGQSAGRAIAEAFAARGAAVVVNDLVAERAEAVAQAIKSAGGRAIAAPFDVTDLASVTAGVETAVKALGPIDILVNNAGNSGGATTVYSPFKDMNPADWQAPIAVNLFGVMNCIHAVLKPMTERGWGRVITISSYAGTHGNTSGLSHYGASKAGALGLMRHVAMESGKAGVTANSIALGIIHQADDPKLNALTKHIPVGRRGGPDDVAALCVYLASEEAGWMTGQTLQLNGGVHTT